MMVFNNSLAYVIVWGIILNYYLSHLPEVEVIKVVLPSKLHGMYASNKQNDIATSGEVFLKDVCVESPYFSENGDFYYIDEKGYVMQRLAGRPESIIWADVGEIGRSLGFKFDADGNMIVADTRGLLKVHHQTKMVEILAVRVTKDQTPIFFADDVEITQNGDVYFTDAVMKSPFSYSSTTSSNAVDVELSSKVNVLEGKPTGRLLRYSNSTGDVDVLLSNLAFANGIVKSPDERFLLVVETWKFRVIRYWLIGEKKGTSDIFINALPGFPDNIRYDRATNTYWIAIFSTPIRFLETIYSYPILRSIILTLPEFLQPKKVPYGLAVQVDAYGKAINSIHDTSGTLISTITTVMPYNGSLYLGSVSSPGVVKYTPSSL